MQALFLCPHADALEEELVSGLGGYRIDHSGVEEGVPVRRFSMQERNQPFEAAGEAVPAKSFARQEEVGQCCAPERGLVRCGHGWMNAVLMGALKQPKVHPAQVDPEAGQACP